MNIIWTSDITVKLNDQNIHAIFWISNVVNALMNFLPLMKKTNSVYAMFVKFITDATLVGSFCFSLLLLLRSASLPKIIEIFLEVFFD